MNWKKGLATVALTGLLFAQTLHVQAQALVVIGAKHLPEFVFLESLVTQGAFDHLTNHDFSNFESRLEISNGFLKLLETGALELNISNGFLKWVETSPHNNLPAWSTSNAFKQVVEDAVAGVVVDGGWNPVLNLEEFVFNEALIPGYGHTDPPSDCVFQSYSLGDGGGAFYAQVQEYRLLITFENAENSSGAAKALMKWIDIAGIEQAFNDSEKRWAKTEAMIQWLSAIETLRFPNLTYEEVEFLSNYWEWLIQVARDVIIDELNDPTIPSDDDIEEWMAID